MSTIFTPTGPGRPRSNAELTKNVKALQADSSEQLAVASIMFSMAAEAGQIDDVTASEHPSMFQAWQPNVAYSVGQIRERNGNLYRCVQAHTSQEGWEPENTPALWAMVADPSIEYPEWIQPLGAHDAYGLGAKVSHNGKKWTSDVDNNVWEPGVYGWTEVQE